jgi:flagellar biosynthesis anti-sigma factor FlgM
MTVNSSGLNVSGAAANSTREAAAAPGAARSAYDAGRQVAPEVSITSTASLLARLQQSLAASSSVDQARVDGISNALAAGTYRVHTDNIAHGLIQAERTLGQLGAAEM